MEYVVGLPFSGAMTRLKLEQWIHNMEEHMEHNKVGSEDMVHYVVKHFIEGEINESKREITWK